MTRLDLFVVDGQNDFCDPKGALFVDKADVEAQLVAAMIDRLADKKVARGHKISKTHASLDSHHRNDGSHNTSWKGQDGMSPPKFTMVSVDDVKNHKWVPRFPIGVWEGQVIPSYQWALKYTAALEANGRSQLCLWPVHCQIGTWGQCIYQPLQDAFDRWCETTSSWMDFITKGDYVWTEHYSALKADVPDPTVVSTQLNTNVVNDVSEADIVAWVGWAGSHCLRWTALDAVNAFPGSNDALIKKSVFFEDASAAVPNIPGAPFKFSEWRDDFLNEVVKRGATLTNTKDFLK